MTAAKAVLDCPMERNDADAATVREYLAALLREVWAQEEGFSGKRPFGNSSWKYDIYAALLKGGLLEGKLDEDGYVEELDREAGDAMVRAAIEELVA